MNKKIGELPSNSSFSSMISKTLFELLPGGETGIDSVAKRMAFSKRTLQRKLAEEDTTFQKELIAARLKLSIYYMRDLKLSNTDIAYLLGYQDLNSFLRAFHSWTGMNTSEYRSALCKNVHNNNFSECNENMNLK